MDAVTSVGLLGGVFGVIAAIVTALNWFVNRSHSNDTQAHIDQFNTVKLLYDQKLDAMSAKLQAELQQHASSIDAHSQVLPRVGVLESDFKNIQSMFLEIKDLLYKLQDKVERSDREG